MTVYYRILFVLYRCTVCTVSTVCTVCTVCVLCALCLHVPAYDVYTVLSALIVVLYYLYRTLVSTVLLFARYYRRNVLTPQLHVSRPAVTEHVVCDPRRARARAGAHVLGKDEKDKCIVRVFGALRHRSFSWSTPLLVSD